jgi:hypothetical protein
MGNIDEVRLGEVVYVKSKDETGAVVRIHPPTITVRFLTAELDVQEDDFERRP